MSLEYRMMGGDWNRTVRDTALCIFLTADGIHFFFLNKPSFKHRDDTYTN